jgi:hypothetical protein
MVLVLVEWVEKVVCVRLRVSVRIVYDFKGGIGGEDVSMVSIKVCDGVESRFL